MTEGSTTSAAGPGAASTFDPTRQIAEELSLPEKSVRSVINLMAEGATIPFIARYRKEATGGLDEVQIRAVGERRTYLIELELTHIRLSTKLRSSKIDSANWRYQYLT